MKHFAIVAIITTLVLTLSGCDNRNSADRTEFSVVHNPLELTDNVEEKIILPPGESTVIKWNGVNCNKALDDRIDREISGRNEHYEWVQIYQVNAFVQWGNPRVEAYIKVFNPTDTVIETTWISLSRDAHYEAANFTC